MKHIMLMPLVLLLLPSPAHRVVSTMYPGSSELHHVLPLVTDCLVSSLGCTSPTDLTSLHPYKWRQSHSCRHLSGTIFPTYQMEISSTAPYPGALKPLPTYLCFHSGELIEISISCQFFNDPFFSNNGLCIKASHLLRDQEASGEGTWFIKNIVVA